MFCCISTLCSQSLSVLNILRKQVFCGNLLGQISVYSVLNGALLAEINAHSRQITALTVATESAYIVRRNKRIFYSHNHLKMSANEDTYVRIWKLHSRNPEAYKVCHLFGGFHDIFALRLNSAMPNASRTCPSWAPALPTPGAAAFWSASTRTSNCCTSKSHGAQTMPAVGALTNNSRPLAMLAC